MKKLLLLAMSVALSATSTFAQISIGRLYPTFSGIDATQGTPVSITDFTHAARTAGTLTEATVYWRMPSPGTLPCSGAYTLQFLRRSSTAMLTYAVATSRGPFTASDGRNTVQLNPPVAISPTDLIGITMLKPASQCGSVWLTSRTVGSGGYMVSPTDLSDGFVDAAFVPNFSPNIFATSTPSYTVGYIAAAGAVAGSFGSFFRTAVQLTNNSSSSVSGRLVFHTYKTQGSPVDPSLPFTVPPRQSIGYSDVVTEMMQSGLGSIDIVTNDGAPINAIARVYNDQGAAGTTGFYEEAVSPDDALQVAQGGTLTLPDDPDNFRTNIGVRTLGSGATVSLAAYDANGSLLGSTTMTFPSNYFEQNGAGAYLGRANFPANSYIVAQVTSGAAIVYGSITDNRTNDSAIHFFRP